ncbi:MAG: carboxypeptidase-like regulatory domain-containing protein [Reyranella sp.]
MNWRLLRHRFVAVPLTLVAIVLAWNIYIAFNDNGILEGQVRDRSGAPVPGATVIFFERNFIYYEEKVRTTTDARGDFRFTGLAVHVGQLEAVTDDGRRSDRRQVRLWFRAQDTEVKPLIVEPRG